MKTINPIEFGNKIRSARKAKWLTLDEVCLNVNTHLEEDSKDKLSKSTLSKAERGKVIPELVTIDKITDGVGLPFDYFYDDFIRLSKNTNAVEEIADRWFVNGCKLQAQKAIGRLFALAKYKEITKKNELIARGLFRLWIFNLTNKNQIKRPLESIIPELKSVNDHDLIKLILMSYNLSKKIHKYEAFLVLCKSLEGHIWSDDSEVFTFLMYYANALYRVKEFDAAYTLFLKSLEFKDCAGVDKHSVALIYNQLGNICSQSCKYEETVHFFRQTIEILNDNKRIELVLGAYHNIARNYYLKGKYDKAREYWDNVLMNVENTDYPIELHILTDYAYMEIRFGNIEKGREFVRRMDSILKESLQKDKSSSEATEALHLRNILLLSDRPSDVTKGLFDVIDRLLSTHLVDEVKETYFTLVEVISTYGIMLNEEEIEKMRFLKKICWR